MTTAKTDRRGFFGRAASYAAAVLALPLVQRAGLLDQGATFIGGEAAVWPEAIATAPLASLAPRATVAGSRASDWLTAEELYRTPSSVSAPWTSAVTVSTTIGPAGLTAAAAEGRLTCDELRAKGLVPTGVECCIPCHNPVTSRDYSVRCTLEGYPAVVCCEVWHALRHAPGKIEVDE